MTGRRSEAQTNSADIFFGLQRLIAKPVQSGE
jgi:hypothetical protein